MRDEAAFNQLTWVTTPDHDSAIRRAQISKISRRCRLAAEEAVSEKGLEREEQMLARYGRLTQQFSQEQLDEIDRRWRERQQAVSQARRGRATAAEIAAVVDGDMILSRCLRLVELADGQTADGEQIDLGDLPDGDYTWILEAVWAHTYPLDEEREGNSPGS